MNGKQGIQTARGTTEQLLISSAEDRVKKNSRRHMCRRFFVDIAPA
jgi:hypothetical protein